MAFNFDLSPTPSAPSNPNAVTPPGQPLYADQDQIKSMLDYASALRGQSIEPVKHWTQGVAHMVDALVGGYMQRRALEDSNARRYGLATDVTNGMPKAPGQGGPAPNPKERVSSNDASGGTPTLVASADPMMPFAKATSTQESGGRYDAIGRDVPRKDGSVDRAYGKYQIMGSNIGPWTKEVLGQELTPEQFLHNPSAQDAVYKTKMGQYVSQYGPEGAGRAWLGGPGGVTHPERRDPNGTQVGEYGQRFAQLAAANGAQPGMMAAAKPALPGGTVTNQQVPGAAPGPFSDVVNIPPGILPPASTYDPHTLARILANPEITGDSLKNYAFGQYQNTQVNPRSVPTLGGNIIVPPGQSKGYFVPQGQWNTPKIGDIQVPKYQWYDPFRGGVQTAPRAPASQAGPRSENAPAQPGAPAGGVAPPNQEVPGRSVGQNASPTKVASTDTNIPIPPQGAGGEAAIPQLPPGLGGKPQPRTVEQATKDLSPVAQAGGGGTSEAPASAPAAGGLPGYPSAPPGVDPEDWNAAMKLKQAGAAAAGEQAGYTNMANKYAKDYETYESQARSSAFQLPQLEFAKRLVTDPKTAQGLLAQPTLFFQRLGDALGITTESGASKGIALQKMFANSVLDGLRAFTQGASVGQIRTMEIALQKLASPQIENTPQANMFLLNILTKMHEQNMAIGQMAAQYAQQHNGKLDPGFDQEVLKYKYSNPVITPQDMQTLVQTAQQQSALDSKAPKPGQSPNASGAQPRQPQEGDTATGPNNAKIKFQGGKWVPVQ